MGTRKSAPLRVVLDTNILISALLFRGELSSLVDLWKKRKIVAVLSRETFAELRRVLEYPKFRLSDEEIGFILEEEILPFFEITTVERMVTGACKDQDDEKFLSCAASAAADYIVTGDKELLKLRQYGPAKIISPSRFKQMLKI